MVGVVATGEGCIGYSVRFGGAKQVREEVKRAVVGMDGDRMPMVIVVVSCFRRIREIGREG